MDDPQTSGGPRDLDSWMNDRRRELRIRWTEVADRASMSSENLRKIRRGQISLSEDAADGIERALAWQPGSVEAVMRGERPTVLSETAAEAHPWPEPPAQVDLASATPGDLRRWLSWWHRRLNSAEDFARLDYLLDLSAALEDRPHSTQSSTQFDAHG